MKILHRFFRAIAIFLLLIGIFYIVPASFSVSGAGWAVIYKNFYVAHFALLNYLLLGVAAYLAFVKKV